MVLLIYKEDILMSNKIQYRLVDDCLISHLILSPEKANITLGKWGMLHKDYLAKHKKVVFTILLSQGKLWQYLADVDTQAQEMFDMLVEQLKEAESITEQFKEVNQMEWIRKMNNIQNRATEKIETDLINK